MLLLVILLGADAGVAAAAAAPVVDAGVAPVPDPGPKPAKGPPPEVRLECLPTPVRIGQRLTCTLKVAHRSDVSVTVLAPPDLVTVEAGPAAPGPTGNLITTRVLTHQVRSMKPVRIEGLTVVWNESDGGEGRVPVEQQKMPVESVLGDVPEPKWVTFSEPGDEDPAVFWARRGPKSMPVTNWALIIGLVVLAAILLGVGVGVAVKRWRDGRVVDVGPWVDPRPAHVIAYERLDRLSADDLPGRGEVMAYYVGLSEIVRDYLERRFRFGAPEMTSEEIRGEIVGLELTPEGRTGIDDFLSETDLVKFADFAPSDSAIDTVLKQAYGVVAATRAAAAPDEEADA